MLHNILCQYHRKTPHLKSRHLNLKLLTHNLLTQHPQLPRVFWIARMLFDGLLHDLRIPQESARLSFPHRQTLSISMLGQYLTSDRRIQRSHQRRRATLLEGLLLLHLNGLASVGVCRHLDAFCKGLLRDAVHEV